MAILKLNDNYTRPVVLAATGLFLCLAGAYFISGIELPHKIAYPVLCLALAGLWVCPWQMCLALVFSAAGDLFGSCGNFIGQMGTFAIGHVLMIFYFIRRYRAKVEKDGRLTTKAKGFLCMILFCTLGILAVSFIRIAPEAPSGVIRIGVCAYSIIISVMLISSMIQRSSLFALGAVLFVFSDFILAWNIFVEAIPNAGLLIMIPYYLGQWLLFIRSTHFRLTLPLRQFRF